MIKNIDNIKIVFSNSFKGSAFITIYEDGLKIITLDISDGNFRKLSKTFNSKDISNKIINWCFENLKDSDKLIERVIRKCVNYMEMYPDRVDDVNDILTSHLMPWNVPLVRVSVKSIYRKRKFIKRSNYDD